MAVDLFFPNEPAGPSHPRLRNWKQRLDSGEAASLEVYRPDVPIGVTGARLRLHFAGNGRNSALEESDWEPTLNEGLMQLRVRAIDRTNEVERFALGLRDGLVPIEREYGNGYFNAVLLDLIIASDLSQNRGIADVVGSIYHDQVDRSTKKYAMCNEGIALAIGARARELHDLLGYSKDEASGIMTDALAQYLDERFSVSARRRFGLM